MTNPQQYSKPTKPTIDYLRILAMATGESFAWPETQREASEEIDRLKGVQRTGRADRRRELAQIRHDMSTGRGGAAAVCDQELSGYGSSATWRAVP